MTNENISGNSVRINGKLVISEDFYRAGDSELLFQGKSIRTKSATIAAAT
ncbi:MAG: hypothetical protein PHG79_10470 [Methanosarcina sp.]|nr:hypothetical protein [Methanosarcina sp.]